MSYWIDWLDKTFLKSETAPAYLTAFAAVVISPIITYFVTRLQIKADTVTKSRQAWIDTLRQDLADLLTLSFRVFADAKAQDRDPNFPGDKKLSSDRYYQFRTLTHKIILSINPTGTDDERKLISKVDGLFEHIRYSEHTGAEDFHDNLDGIRRLAQDVLKSEWDRVAEGEANNIWIIAYGFLKFLGLQYVINMVKWIIGKFKKD